MPILTLLWRYRKWAAIVLLAAVLVIAALTYRHKLIAAGRAQGRAEISKAWADSIAVANRETARKDTAYKALQGERDKAASDVQALLNRPAPDPKTLIVRIPIHAPVNACPDRSPEWRLQYNALADAADNGAPVTR